MNGVSNVLGFLLRFLALYLLLMIPWPGVESAYCSVFSQTGSFLYRNFGEHYDVQTVASKAEGKGPDVVILVPRYDMGGQLRLGISSREVGYLAMAVSISLLVATPVAWRRRLWILAVGFGSTCLFVIVRPLPLVLYTRLEDAEILSETIEPSAYQESLAAVAKFVGYGQPMSYIVPIIIWVLVAVRRDVVVRFIPELDHTAAQGSNDS